VRRGATLTGALKTGTGARRVRRPDDPRLLAREEGCRHLERTILAQERIVMLRNAKWPVAALMVAVAACGGAGENADVDRDITLAPAESVAALDDQPQDPTATPNAQPAAPAARRAPTRPAAPASLRLAEGTAIVIQATDTITSRTNKAGESITAVVGEDVTDENGRVVLPAGAVLEGTITEIKPAPNPQAVGTLSLAFTVVRIGDDRFPIDAAVDSLGTERQGRGVTGGDAAKVGVGAAAGAIAGRVIGGDATGTVVGGVIGAATGAGVAAITKDSDIVLPAGALVRIVLQAPFERRP
jgi:hypothetical protein